MTIGKRIREARIAAGLTQSQLAELCKLATITIQQYERDKRQPRHDQLEILADKLNVTTGYFFGIDDINAKAVIDALNSGDYRTAEMLMDLPVGTLGPVDEERSSRFRPRHTDISILDEEKIRAALGISEEEYDRETRLLTAFYALNDWGQEMAVGHIEDLAEIPKYKKEPPQD